MSILYIMIPIALILAGLAVIGFILAARSGQFDDVDTPASRMLFDDQPTDNNPKEYHPIDPLDLYLRVILKC